MSQTNITIDNKINPNTAPAGSLVRLPNIGPARAKAIIEYRSGFGDNELAFKTCNDLENIKGIGPKTVENLQGWLYFE